MNFSIAKITAAAFILSLLAPTAFIKPAQSADDQSGYEADYAAAKKLQSALKQGDMQAVANLIQYPFRREQPLPDIKNSKEFLTVSSDYFDATSIKMVTSIKAEQIGWRGIQIASGAIWFNNGKVIALNLKTDAYKRRVAEAKKLESRTLYPAARGYDKIAFQCDTKTLHVRTQYHGKDLRYFAWSKDAPLSSKPKLMLTSGEYISEGNGGNYDLEFKNGIYRYELESVYICGEDCNSYLNVFKSDDRILHQVCKQP